MVAFSSINGSQEFFEFQLLTFSKTGFLVLHDLESQNRFASILIADKHIAQLNCLS